MIDMMRHVGKIANTDQRCVVAFMQIPNREDHALVIPTDTLPPRYEQAVMDVLKSPEGQNEECFGVALSRRLMPDTGKDIFATLHEGAMLIAVPCSRILMLPRPNQPIKLTEILAQLGRATRSDETMRPDALEKYNPHTSNMLADQMDQKRAMARNLLVEAEYWEREALKKREAAYLQDPSLRPYTPVDTMPQVSEYHSGPVQTNRINDPGQFTLDSLLAPSSE